MHTQERRWGLLRLLLVGLMSTNVACNRAEEAVGSTTQADTGCGLYATNLGGCYTDCHNDSMCAAGAYCYQSTACHLDHCAGVNADDGNACTGDSCDRETGVVSHTNYPSNTSCLDWNPCNGDEMCNGAGSCVPGTPLP